MKKNTVGVVVGRFQTHRLHDGHRYLIDEVVSRSEKVLIVIGESGGFSCSHDPMDFCVRSAMVRSAYPNAVVVSITDHPSNDYWSEQLDRVILENFPGYEVTLYGSRESFLPYYKGMYEKFELEPMPNSPSATFLRKSVANEVIDSEDFRKGVIYANTKQIFPTSFQAVDVVIRHSLERKVLVGRKAGEKAWRFPGGFVDPTDDSLERAVKREAKEEVGDIELADVKYICSKRIKDHRYRNSEHKVMSALYTAVYVFGSVQAGDDLAEVRWQDFDTLVENLIHEHKPLGEAFLREVDKH